MHYILALAIDSAGVGLGIFIGLSIGLIIRARRGVTEGLIGGSAFLTSAIIGVACMLLFMLMKHFFG